MSRRRRSIRYPFWLAVATVITVGAGYVFALPFWQAWNDPLVAPSDLYAPRAIDALVFFWSFWIGSSIGSFLNVVAWRMPRGESINGRSHCPRCMAQLRARDNLPVFGWLALGGRCYRCRLPISVRYPIVEAAVGLSIAAVCVAELYQFSLPRQTVHVHPGPFRAPVVDFEIMSTMVYHVTALSVAWACGLIGLDGKRLPGKLVVFAMAVTVLPMIVYPTLMVVPWQMSVPSHWRPHALYIDAVVRVATALAAATILGRYLAKAFCPAADPKLDPLGQSTARLIDLIVMLSIPALVVGWQAVIAVVVIASLLGAAMHHRLRPRREAFGRFGIALPIALTFQLVFWRQLHAPDPSSLEPVGTWIWPSEGGLPWVLLGWAGIVLLIPLWLRDAPPKSLVIPVPSPDPNLEAPAAYGLVGESEDDDELSDAEDSSAADERQEGDKPGGDDDEDANRDEGDAPGRPAMQHPLPPNAHDRPS